MTSFRHRRPGLRLLEQADLRRRHLGRVRGARRRTPPSRRRPAALDHPEAAALPLAAVTALLAIDAVVPQPGETVLVTGAGGAVGAYVVQLAAAAGARVVATAKPSDEARLRSWGADAVIDYRCGDVGAVARGAGDRPGPGAVDIVHDAPELTRLAELVEDGGRVASARFAADADVLGRRGISVGNVDAQRCGPAPLIRVADLVRDGRLDPLVDHVQPFERVGDEVARHLAGGRGKVAFVTTSDGGCDAARRRPARFGAAAVDGRGAGS